MLVKKSGASVVELLPFIVALWLIYLLAQALIDHTVYPRPEFPLFYYLLNGGNALAVLGLMRWLKDQSKWKPVVLPLEIGTMTVIPVVSTNLAALGRPPNPATSPEAILMRLMPMLFMALVLTAWQYGWWHVLMFSAGTALIPLGTSILLARPEAVSLLPPITVTVIQTVSFLTVGYFINTLATRLKQQQISLEGANFQLVQHASALERLTISRERNRVARELHDTLAHTLSALSVQLETVKAYWEIDPPAAKQILDESLTVTRSGLQETLRALKSLRASPLDDLGLALALRKSAEETAARANLILDLSLPDKPISLAAEVEQAVYRIAQEAMANAA